MIYDEAWRLIAQPSLLARMQSQWKLSRALGIANLMVIHRLSDLDAVGDANSEVRNLALGLLADCSTKIVYAQETGEASKTGGVLGLSSTEISSSRNWRWARAYGGSVNAPSWSAISAPPRSWPSSTPMPV